MAKKKLYTADKIKALRERLTEHRRDLATSIASAAAGAAIGFDDAIAIREYAMQLVSTCLALDNIASWLHLAEVTGEPQSLPNLDDCGLEF